MSKDECWDNASGSKKRIRLKAPHTCVYDGCTKVYFMKQHLDRHVKTYHQKLTQRERRFICELCQEKFTTKQNLQKHIHGKHKKDSNFICEFCSKRFTRYTLLAHHLHFHTGENFLRCKYCEKTFSNQIKRSRHQSRHKTFFCDSCDTVFTVWTDLMKHKRTKHTTEEYHCDICKKIFKHRSGIVNHLKLHYNADSIFVCPECPKTYTLKKNLKAHITSVHEHITFDCVFPQCEAKLSTKDKLKRHYMSKHLSKELIVPMQSKPLIKERKIRKDAGSMKRSSLIKLSNDVVSLKEEKDLIIASMLYAEKQISDE